MAETELIRTPDQRLRVFVSSTLQELAPERQAVRDPVTRLRLVPVLFELDARPQPPREVYRAYLAQSQVFVGVYSQQPVGAAGAPLPRQRGLVRWWPSSALSRRALILFLNAVSSVRSWIAGLLASMAPDRERPEAADRVVCSPPG
jgi:hypothetical protein